PPSPPASSTLSLHDALPIYGVRRGNQQQRIAVGRRRDDRLRRDIAAGTRSVLYDDLLADALRQRLRHDAGNDIGRPAGRKEPTGDRKSTRLNSSHLGISYAV